MQPSNSRLYAINCHLQLYFVISTSTHHHFQFITIIKTMVQLIYNYQFFHPSMLTNILGFFIQK
jgi:hypothetical protein